VVQQPPSVAQPSFYPVYLLLDGDSIPEADRIFAQLQTNALSGFDNPEANDLLVIDRDTIDSGPSRPGEKKKRVATTKVGPPQLCSPPPTACVFVFAEKGCCC
jgi:hypothetical protein